MTKENLIASPETKDFFKELPIPQGVNGNEVNGKLYFEAFMNPSKSFDELATLTETFRRMQDFYETINAGRFFLANSQRKNYPEIYSGDPPAWANDWIKTQYINSAIHSYSASFDIFLQILWIGYALYKQYPQKSPIVLSEKNLTEILKTCNVNFVVSQKNILGEQLSNRIKNFRDAQNTKNIRNLCKQIKHRQGIAYSELCADKHPIMIKSDSYNSQNTLSIYAINDVIGMLKNFHLDMTDLSNSVIPVIKNHLGQGR